MKLKEDFEPIPSGKTCFNVKLSKIVARAGHDSLRNGCEVLTTILGHNNLKCSDLNTLHPQATLADMNQESQEAKDLMTGLSTSARLMKLKTLEDNNMNVYMMEALKSKVDEFEDQGKHPKLFTMCSIIKGQSRKQIGKEIG
ncbi:hypothetical protein M9H77_13216 [Catharanthus roseus]|uniref:Uncharacterized protein n=1 Tax=Catharanthus roseus TaxID=4058 RepID=A0ACC0BJT4_CATRO|nr:hypothetical protein M9H77_13216 [Catharanthus roseus]